MSAPVVPDLTKELVEAVGKSASVQAVPAAKNVAKASPQDIEPTANMVPALLITVRFALNVTEADRERVTKQIEKIAKRDGMPPIVLCPQGVNIAPVFEPTEMRHWRDEIMDLRCTVAKLQAQLDAQKSQFSSVQRAAAIISGGTTVPTRSR